MQKILFYHGGPGMNGNPERQLLTRKFQDNRFEFICWDEPSSLRPEGYQFSAENAFENYEKSAAKFLKEHTAEEPAIVVIYCFSSMVVEHIASLHAERIKFFAIITPDFLQSKTDLNIFNLIKSDYQYHKDEREKELKTIIANYSGFFDDNAIRGWELAIGNPRMFDFYWADTAQMQQYLQHYRNEFSLDPESFFNVRKTLVIRDFKTDVPTLVLYSNKEKITDVPDELKKVQDCFNNLELIEMKHSTHYPHIEETDRFIEILKDQASR